MPRQLPLQYIEPKRINVQGRVDPRYPEISYLGEAIEQVDGTYQCLAKIDRWLCWVEIKVKLEASNDHDH